MSSTLLYLLFAVTQLRDNATGVALPEAVPKTEFGCFVFVLFCSDTSACIALFLALSVCTFLYVITKAVTEINFRVGGGGGNKINL